MMNKGKKEKVSGNVISQKTLDDECMSLEESKKRIIEKIHNHFVTNKGWSSPCAGPKKSIIAK